MQSENRRLENIEMAKIVTGKHESRFSMDMEAVRELAESIQAEGLINPITVSQQGDVYVVVVGHRRVAAVKHLGKTHIDAFVSNEPPEILENQIRAENIHRVDLKPTEIADDMYKLIIEQEKPVSEVAAMYKKSEGWVRSHLAITTWPECLVDPVHNGMLSKAAAEELFKVKDTDTLEFFVRQAVEGGASARVCRSWADSWLAQIPPQEAVAMEPDAAPSNVQPMTLSMPCLCCRNSYSPDELVHAYLCVHCHGRVQQLPTDDYR